MTSSRKSSVSSVGSTASSTTKSHVCDFPGCLKAYSKPSLLEQHKRSHTNERPFKCNYGDCEKGFLRKSHLQTHLLSHQDQDAKPFHCPTCGKGVNTLQHLKRHEITHTKSFSCTYEGCDQSFYKHQSLRHHILSVHEKKLNCHLCNKTFSRPYRLAQHNIKYHSDSPTYQCDHHGCFTNFKTWSALQLHIKTEHPKLKCIICGKGCVGKKGLKSHMITHDEQNVIKLWNCNYCNMGKFAKKIDLIEHYNAFHDGNLPEDLLKPSEREQLEKLLSETDSSRKDIGQHIILSDEESDREFTDINSEERGSQKSLDSFNSTMKSSTSIVHLILNNYNTKKIICPKRNCGRKFSRDYDLQRHLTWHNKQLQKIEAFLSSLEDEGDGTNDSAEKVVNEKKRRIVDISDEYSEVKKAPKLAENDEYEDDNELDDLIDLELKLIQAGSL